MTLFTLSEAHITEWGSRYPASFVQRRLRQLRGMRLSEPPTNLVLSPWISRDLQHSLRATFDAALCLDFWSM
jgi:hypothetical protein